MHPCTLNRVAKQRALQHTVARSCECPRSEGLLSPTPAPDFMLSDASVSYSCTCYSYSDDDIYAFARIAEIAPLCHFHLYHLFFPLLFLFLETLKYFDNLVAGHFQTRKTGFQLGCHGSSSATICHQLCSRIQNTIFHFDNSLHWRRISLTRKEAGRGIYEADQVAA